MADLTKDHHIKGSGKRTNGNNMNVTINYDLTYHYDLQAQNIVVTNTQFTVTPSDDYDHGIPGWGFNDAFMMVKPDTPLPNEHAYYINGSHQGSRGQMMFLE